MNAEMFYNPYVIIILFFWELIWKGFALYKSAQNKRKVWFIALLLLNTVGILPILYFVFENYNVDEKLKKFFGKYSKKMPKIKLPKLSLKKK